VKRDELEELHYITPLNNVLSICQLGILSHRQVKEVDHDSVAMQEIQDRRVKVVVPGGWRLHEYVNLYICARNPMLSKRKNQHDTLCVLRISPSVLDLPGVVVTDGNASSQYVRFAAAPGGLHIVNRDLTFAEYWTDPDPIQYFRRKSAKCAEVLVPECVEPRFLIGAYVSCDESLARWSAMGILISAVIDRHLFFR
jgi:hypothetical protein